MGLGSSEFSSTDIDDIVVAAQPMLSENFSFFCLTRILCADITRNSFNALDDSAAFDVLIFDFSDSHAPLVDLFCETVGEGISLSFVTLVCSWGVNFEEILG